MPTLLQINSCNFASTGNIMLGISTLAQNCGYTSYIACPASKTNYRNKYQNQIFIGTRLSRNMHRLISRYMGFQGMGSVVDTLLFLSKVSRLKPDIIHLHNLHDSYINIPLLFRYLKKHSETKVVWTLHDCWAVTGQCPYFTIAQCDKWKTGCHHCEQIDVYPSSRVDRTKSMWQRKKKWFTGVQNMTIVTPSKWLAGIVSESYLRNYPLKVIHNGIDLTVFKPTAGNFQKTYNIENKIVLLGVAFGWGIRKGLDVFIELSHRLDQNEYQIVLIGTDEEVDKQLSDNTISIHIVQSQKELATIYSAADLFVNPTREENYPTVNMESIACGTPVLTFRTGGSPEVLDENCGLVVDCDDVDALESEIIRITKEKLFTMENCLHRAESFDKNERFNEYIDLYTEEAVVDVPEITNKS